MSTTINPTHEPAMLDITEQIARIDRAQAETRKFAAEQNKLAAEAAKLKVDRFLSPLIGVGSGLLVAVLAHFWR